MNLLGVSTKISYALIGLMLVISGAMLSLASFYILRSTPLTALGFSMIIVGVVSLALSMGQPKILSEAISILIESSLMNVSSIIEELGISSKAIYLPSTMASGQPQALIPLYMNQEQPKLTNRLPKRLIVKYGANPEDIGLLITTPGSTITSMLGSKPGPTPSDLEAALSSALTKITELADSVKITVSGDMVVAEISNPHFANRSMWVHEFLGSPIASITASLAAETFDKPVTIEREEHRKGKSIIELKVL